MRKSILTAGFAMLATTISPVMAQDVLQPDTDEPGIAVPVQETPIPPESGEPPVSSPPMTADPLPPVMTAEQQANYDLFTPDQQQAYDTWPIDTQSYYWNLPAPRQQTFWRLSDNDRNALGIMTAADQNTAWGVIERRLAEMDAMAEPVPAPEPGSEPDGM